MTNELDPQVADLLRAADKAGVPPIHSLPYKEARDFYLLTSKKLAGEPPDKLDVSDLIIETSVAPVPIRIYRPPGTSDQPLPALVYFHGGG